MERENESRTALRVRTDHCVGGDRGGAGLSAGDTILSYDGVRIYRPQDLRGAIASATEGTLVRVEVQAAGGRQRDIRLPAGPIGIRMAPSRMAP